MTKRTKKKGVRGRRCAICGKPGGTAYTLPLRWLRDSGARLKNDGSYAHDVCMNKTHTGGGRPLGRVGLPPGRGRPNELGDSKLIAVRFPLETIRRLEAEAKKRGVSVSEVVRSYVAK